MMMTRRSWLPSREVIQTLRNAFAPVSTRTSNPSKQDARMTYTQTQKDRGEALQPLLNAVFWILVPLFPKMRPAYRSWMITCTWHGSRGWSIGSSSQRHVRICSKASAGKQQPACNPVASRRVAALHSASQWLPLQMASRHPAKQFLRGNA